MGPRAWRRARRHRQLLSEAIDRAFYVAQLAEPPGEDFDPVEHYLAEGWKTGFEPAPWFDHQHYAFVNADAAASGLPPFLHYLVHGKNENRPIEASPAGYEDVRPWFDEAFYRAHNPELALGGVDAFDHFAYTGWREGRDPNAWFSLAAWREANPDAPDDINPLALHMREGLRFGRPLAPGQPVWRRSTWAARRQRAAESGFIDERFYLEAYPEIAAAGLSALDHYLVAGAAERRNPGPRFDTGWWAAQRGVALADALFDFLDQQAFLHQPLGAGDGRPKLAATFDPEAETAPARCAVHLHLRHIELGEPLLSALARWPADIEIWASVRSEADAAWLRRRIAALRPQASLDVRRDPAIDSGVLPAAFADRAASIDAVLCVHSEPPLGGRSDDGERRRRLLDRLFGSPAAVGQAAAWFVQWPDLGWLHAETDFHLPLAAGEAEAGRVELAGWLNPRALAALAPAGALTSVYDVDAAPLDQEARLAGALALRLASASWRAAPFVWTERRGVAMGPSTPSDPRLSTPSHRWPRENPAVAIHGPKPLAPHSKVFDPKRLDIAWIMPDLLLGSGGHMTILRLVEQLARFGHRQTIWVQNPRGPDPQAIKRQMQQWFRPIPDDVAVVGLPDDVRAISADAVIATEAWTAFPAANVTNAKARFYLIQDYEPLFHPAGEAAMLAEQTYGLGLDALTAGDWLLGKAQGHGMWARKWDLAVDHAVYFAPPKKKPAAAGPPRIAVYARRSTPRRSVGLAFAALTELAKRGVAFEAVLFGDDNPPADLAFPHVHAGIVDAQGLGDLYRRSDVGLVFSATNYSLVPLEMMACDLPVVELDGESTRAVFKDGEALLAAPHPTAVADALQGLLSDAAARKAQAARGRAFVKALSWEASARSVEAALVERLGEVGAKAIDPQKVCAPAIGKVKRVSVVIPTYNGGRLFDRVLAAAASQDCSFEYDVLVIDSGSTDRTAEVASKVGGRVWLHTLPKDQFQHGRTRNLGVELTDGDIVAFLTQDALPGDRQWLQRLVEGFDVSSRTALVYGRHRAYPAHGLFAARDLDGMFDRFHELGPLYSGRLGLPSFIHAGSEAWRRLMGFYSDNNSALLRAAWKELPYPEIDWGEDQVLGWEMVRQGFDKVYADQAVVFHSHQRKAGDQLQVAIEEGQLFKREFGVDLVGEAEAPGLVAAMTAADTAWAAAHELTPGALAMRLESQRLAVEGRLRGAAREAWGQAPKD